MSVVIIEDTGNKQGFHTVKNAYWEKEGIDVMRYPLPVGDYILANEAVFDVIARKKARGLDPKKMDFVGSYKVCCDTKNSIEELAMDVCVQKQHERFRDELILAQNNGIKLYIVVENSGGLVKYTRNVYNPVIRELKDLSKWVNPRLFIRKGGKQAYPKAVRGVTLMKACYTLKQRYNCEFVFCTPEESGKTIIDLLTKSR